VDTGCITMLRLCRLCNYRLKMDKYRPGVTPNSNKKPKSSTKMTYQPSQTPLKSTLTPFLNAERTLKKNVVLANRGQKDNWGKEDGMVCKEGDVPEVDDMIIVEGDRSTGERLRREPVHSPESGHNVLVDGLFHTQLAAYSLMLILEDSGNR